MPPSINKAPKKKEERSQAELRTALEQKSLALKSILEAGMAEYEKADTDDEATEKKLLTLVERVEKMRAQLDSGEVLTDTPEADTKTLEPFLKETFEKWYSSDKTFTQPDQQPSTVNPTDLDLPSRKSDTDPTKFGEYTLNPECIGIDFEKATIISLDITKDKGYLALPSKDLATVAQFIITTYGKKYILPDLSFYQWAIENSAKAHAVFNDDSKYYFFPGSTLRNRDGQWNVPYTLWSGSSFRRSAGWLADDWRSSVRVVLLER